MNGLHMTGLGHVPASVAGIWCLKRKGAVWDLSISCTYTISVQWVKRSEQSPGFPHYKLEVATCIELKSSIPILVFYKEKSRSLKSPATYRYSYGFAAQHTRHGPGYVEVESICGLQLAVHQVIGIKTGGMHGGFPWIMNIQICHSQHLTCT